MTDTITDDTDLDLNAPDENAGGQPDDNQPDPNDPPEPNAENLPAEGEGGDEEGELSISFGEVKPPDDEDVFTERTDDSGIIKKLRSIARENQRKLRELEKQQQVAKPDDMPQLRDKPTLESHDFDPEAFEADLQQWFSEKSTVDAKRQQIEKQQQEQVQAVQQRIEAYNQRKTQLGAKDYEQAEAEVSAMFDNVKQGILLEASDKPELLVYGLYRNPKELERLSQITSPAKFAAEIGKLEGKLNVSRQTSKPNPPDTDLRSSASATSVDKKLEQLEKEAERTGDRTKLLEYKRQLKRK